MAPRFDSSTCSLLLSTLFLALACQPTQPAFDVLIRGGDVVDGTGSPARRADVGVRGDTIVEVGDLAEATATRVIDATGLTVTPGFIDMHSHSDFTLLVDGRGLSKVMQGVTTELLGEFESPGPAVGLIRPELEKALAVQELKLDWETLAQYFERLERQRIAVNVVSLVGAGQVRAAVVGYDNRPPTPDELKRMEQLVDSAMQDGAVGLSSGLIYVPNAYATTDELITLAKVAARHGGIYVSHIRNEGEQLLDALNEAVRIGHEADLPVEVLHFKRSGIDLNLQPNSPEKSAIREAAALIENAQKDGVRIAGNVYPYAASSTTLNTVLPAWSVEGGNPKMVERLREPATRTRIRNEVRSALASSIGGRRADTIMLARTPYEPHRPYQGQRMSQIAEAMKLEPADALLDIVDKSEGLAGGVYFGMREEDVAFALSRPWTSVGSDGSALAPSGILARTHPHPRSYGTFPRVLKRYVLEQKVLTLPDAIRKMTSLPAERLGLTERGVVAPGEKADLAVIDLATVEDKATFEAPQQLATGVRWLLVNGGIVVANGESTGELPGKVLRHKSAAGVTTSGSQ